MLSERTETTSELTYRVLLSTAVGYVRYIEETDRALLEFWGSIYGKGDIQRWARSQISEILESANRLNLNSDQLTSVLSVGHQHVERLEWVGFQFSNAPTQGAGGTKISV